MEIRYLFTATVDTEYQIFAGLPGRGSVDIGIVEFGVAGDLDVVGAKADIFELGQARMRHRCATADQLDAVKP